MLQISKKFYLSWESFALLNLYTLKFIWKDFKGRETSRIKTCEKSGFISVRTVYVWTNAYIHIYREIIVISETGGEGGWGGVYLHE